MHAIRDGGPVTNPDSDQTNSGLESLVIPGIPSFISVRVLNPLFDRDGVLWTLSTLVDNALKSFDPSTGQWKSYDFTPVTGDGFTGGNLGYADIVIGNDGTKWIASYKFGLIGFNENGSSPLIKSVYKEEENMPTELATAVALDNRNQLWIGNFRGLRVLYNTSNFFTDDNITVDEIIIEEDGIAKELLFEQYVTDIEVDGSNNKWIGTTDSGLFYLSSDGQNTIFHFTKDNSPLPSNGITDMAIDHTSGEVYFATEKGMISFNSNATASASNLENVYAFPNPVRPEHMKDPNFKLKIRGLVDGSNLKITDISGNLVYETTVEGGTTFDWDMTAFGAHKVASGVYLIMVTTKDSEETTIEKVMVIN